MRLNTEPFCGVEYEVMAATLKKEEERLKELYLVVLPGMRQSKILIRDTNSSARQIFKPYQEEPPDRNRNTH